MNGHAFESDRFETLEPHEVLGLIERITDYDLRCDDNPTVAAVAEATGHTHAEVRLALTKLRHDAHTLTLEERLVRVERFLGEGVTTAELVDVEPMSLTEANPTLDPRLDFSCPPTILRAGVHTQKKKVLKPKSFVARHGTDTFFVLLAVACLAVSGAIYAAVTLISNIHR